MNYIEDLLRRQEQLFLSLLGAQTPDEIEPTVPQAVSAESREPQEAAPAEHFALRHQLEQRSVRQKQAAAQALGLHQASKESFPPLRQEIGAESFGTETIREFSQARSTAAAQTLSRIFERDARRYNGGYSLY